MRGYQLWQVQDGEEPADWKPMPTVGAGVIELRVQHENEYRVLYVAKFVEAVYVLHAFVKKSQRTTPNDVRLAHQRYRALIAARKEQ